MPVKRVEAVSNDSSFTLYHSATLFELRDPTVYEPCAGMGKGVLPTNGTLEAVESTGRHL